MHTLRTWMNDDGFAFPSLRTWAEGACMSVNTLTKHYKTALREGWLAVERKREGIGQDWKRNSYRAAVPSHIVLPERDAELADALASVFGDIEDDDQPSTETDTLEGHHREAVSLHIDTPSTLNGQTCITHADTPSTQHHEAVSPIDDTPHDVSTETPGVLAEFDERCVKSAPEGVSKNGEGVSNYPPTCVRGVSAKSPNPLPPLETGPEASEALEALERSKREGAALTRSTGVGNGFKKPPENAELTGQARLDAAQTLTKASGIDAATKQYRLTETEAEQILRQP
jgi:hypothetical protein